MILSAVAVAALTADITKLSGCTREIGPSVRTLSSASVESSTVVLHLFVAVDKSFSVLRVILFFRLFDLELCISKLV